MATRANDRMDSHEKECGRRYAELNGTLGAIQRTIALAIKSILGLLVTILLALVGWITAGLHVHLGS